jgi:hypothetical protein
VGSPHDFAFPLADTDGGCVRTCCRVDRIGHNTGSNAGCTTPEEDRRRLDRKVLATALLCEVNFLMERLDLEEQNYRKLREILRRGLRPPPFTGSGLEFRVSVYAKCADQLGKLGVELADDLVNFYEFIDGVRDDAPRFYLEDTPPEVRGDALDGVLNELWPVGLVRGRASRGKLEAAVNEP